MFADYLRVSRDVFPSTGRSEIGDGNVILISLGFYYSTGELKRDAILGEVLSRWIEGDYYSRLRSQKQLAYSLGIYNSNYHGQAYHMIAYLRSGTSTSKVVLNEMEAYFIDWVENTLATKTQKDLDELLIVINKQQRQDVEEDRHGILIEDLIYTNLMAFDFSDISIDIDEFKQWAKKVLIEDPTLEKIIVTPKVSKSVLFGG